MNTTFRTAKAGDEEFLREMAATFHQPLRPWGEPADFGLIAEADGVPRGAAWYRQHQGSTDGFRELYVGVAQESRCQGIGAELFRRIVDAGRDDEAVRALVGVPTPDTEGWSIPLLREAGFVLLGKRTWLLVLDSGLNSLLD
jgi:GNAT superfamily N-acetyltransferase